MCTDYDICRDCAPPSDGQPADANCEAVEYKKYYIGDHYSVKGEDQMKAELAAHGPISCGVHATDLFETTYNQIVEGEGDYIYKETVRFPMINHEISVVGYGVDATTGEGYWKARNSWGTYWGDYGFFYLPMGKASTNLAIETDCVAGIPSYTQAAEAKLEAEMFFQ